MRRIGINPLTWSNDDMPSLGADISLEQCLSEAKEAGYAGVELGHKFPRDPEVLGPILEHHGLALVSGWTSGHLLERSVAAELRAMEPHLDLLRRLGATVVIYAEVTGAVHGDPTSAVGRRPVMHPEALKKYGASLTELADALRSEGLQLAYHHHMGTVIQTEDEIRQLMEHTSDAVGLLLDTGHLTYAGGDPVETAKRHRDRIHHLHLKDVRREVLSQASDLAFLSAVVRGVFTVPGDGCVDFAGVLDAMDDYDGWLVVEAEQDPEVADPITYAKLGYRTISQLLERS